MRRLAFLISVLHSITMFAQPPVSGNSCATATILCNQSNFTMANFPANSNSFTPPCFTASLQQPVFYQFTVAQTGTLAWTATPLAAAEYDWAVYDITNGCPGTVLRCNYHFANGVGATIGMSSASGTNCPVSSIGGPVSRELCPAAIVTAGSTYLIIIDNYSANGVGFNFIWGCSFLFAPTAAFTVSPSNACQPVSATIANNSLGAANSVWDFGDSSTSNSASPPAHSYTSAGTYTITLTTTAANGCSNTTTNNVVVKPVPVMSAVSNISVCRGGSVNAIAFASAPLADTYNWTNTNVSTGLANSGTGDITAFTALNMGSTALNSVVTVTPVLNGCSGNAVTFTLTVEPAPVVTVPLNVTVCDGSTVGASLFTSSVIGTTYQWTNSASSVGLAASGTGDVPAFTAVNTTSAPINAVITVTPVSAALCNGNAMSYTITVNPSSAISINSTTICNGQNAALTPTPLNVGGSYLWASLALTTQAISISPAATATYTVAYTLLGCSSTATSTVTVNPVPSISINNTTICAGGTSTLTATPSLAGGQYLWAIGGETWQVINVSPASSTTYSLTYTLNGCGNSANSSVTVHPLPTLTVSPTTTICNGQSATLVANADIGGGNYLWASSLQTVASINVTPANTTTYTVSYMVQNCSSSAMVDVVVNPVPTLSVTSASICSGQNALIIATPSINGGNYNWISGGQTSQSLMIAPITTSLYAVNYTLAGCTSNTPTATVTAYPLPVATFTYSSNVVCANAGLLTPIYNGGASAGVFSSLPAGIAFTTIAGQINTQLSASGTYTVSNGFAAYGTCPAVVHSEVITIVPNPAPMATNNSPVCEDEVLRLYSSINGGSVSWVGPNGFTSAQQNPLVSNDAKPMMGGNYHVTVTTNGCSGSSSTAVTVNTRPAALFTAAEKTSIANPVVHFYDASSGAVSWLWNFGDGYSANNTSTLQNPEHQYSETGSYCVQLVVKNVNNCRDSSEFCLFITPEFIFYIPSAFSPNGDGINEEFFAKGENIAEFELRVFDRWGNTVFSADDITKHWDGTPQSGRKTAQEDVYVYMIKVKDNLGQLHKYNGMVTVIR